MLPFELGLGQGAALALVLIAAAFVRGYSGFGFSALVLAGGGLVMNPVVLIPMVMLCEVAMTGAQSRGIQAEIDWSRVWPLLAGAVVAMPLAVWVLARIGADPARLAISGMIMVFCVVLLTGWTLRRPVGRLGHAGVGMVSGLANGAAVGGLPVAAFLAAQPVPAKVFRATMVAYLTLIDLVALPLFWANGLIGRDTFVAFALALPLIALGLWLGGRRFLAASPQEFRRLAIRLLIGLSALGLLKSVL